MMKRKHWMVGLFIGLSILLVQSVTVAYAVDHSDYGTVLNRHVEGGYFDYDQCMKNEKSRDLLDRYLAVMSRVDLSGLSDKEALAYWMNLYNAATIKLIENHYPVESIKDIGGWFSTPWQVEFVETSRGTKTLDQIEHEIIRPRFNEPRIHYALVCAAKSCPPLRDEPYDPDRLS